MYSLHLIFSCCLFLLIVTCYACSRYASIFHPLTYYLAFHGLVFVVRPCFQYIFNYDSIYLLYGFHPTIYTKHLTLLITNIGLLCFTAAVLSTGNVAMRFASSDRSVAGNADRGGRQLILVALACAPIIIASIRVVMTTFTDYGSSELYTFVQGRTLLGQGTSGYILDANVMLGTIGVLIAWTYRFRVLSLIPFGAFFAFRMAAGGGRWTFIMASASLMLVYLYDERKKWPLLKFSLYGMLLLFIFYQIGNYRRAVLDLVWQAPAGYNNDVQIDCDLCSKGFFDDMDFANLEYLEYVVMAVPEMTGTYDYFVNNLEIFTAWIPRNLWPNKPAGPPIEFYDLWDYGSPIGMTQSIVGRGWADLGVVGVAIWCSLGGAAWGLYYKWFAQSQQTRFEVATYAMMLPLSVQWFRDGVLITMVKFPLFWILPIVLWLLVSKIWRVPARQSRAFSVQ